LPDQFDSVYCEKSEIWFCLKIYSGSLYFSYVKPQKIAPCKMLQLFVFDEKDMPVCKKGCI